MEILKRGQLPEEQNHVASCARCKAQVRFTRGEAEYVFDQRDGDFLRVTCPVCGHAIIASLRNKS